MQQQHLYCSVCGYDFGVLAGNFDRCRRCKGWVQVVDRASWVWMMHERRTQSIRDRERERQQGPQYAPWQQLPSSGSATTATDADTQQLRSILSLWR